ncbi:MAG: hypothetical protein KGN84_04730, partial [Acidobacteriota bacterium]|nr:hypothetical protein [Acidobacteriota bacterium]
MASAGLALAQPALTISPSPVSFTYMIGGNAPGAQNVSISATGTGTAMVTSGTVAYLSGPQTGWLSVIPIATSASAGNPAMITLYLTSPGTLVAGNYIANVTLTYSGATTASDSFAVFLAVSGSSGGGGAPGETITVNPTSLTFAYSPGGATPTPQNITVAVSDGAAFTISAVTNDGAQWLLAGVGATANTVTVAVNPAILNPGTFTGNVTISAPFAAVQVGVTLSVGANTITVQPASVSFSAPQNSGVSASQSFQVTTTTPAAIQAFAQSDNNWLLLDTNTATSPAQISMRANAGSLAQGTYNGSVTVQTSPANQLTVPVTLTVGPPATLRL